jgi:lipopolysaccharide transport system ATP-binding protein
MSEKDVILKVENVSKLYRLGTVGTGTFGGDVQRFWKTKILGQEDPFIKIGQTNDRTSKEKADFVWALKDINFEVKRGEVLGIIGKNGAGKSTLLKLLSRITSPTTGSIKSAGRMASLLEVGTGFHPELTGRENIFLNGAILGMTKKEIQSKFDEIVDFSGCDLYIDTPTKRYSSGMTVRLGFAVAAFLDPEILVVDEVLAVGDAEFQKKAIGKMKDISNGEGRTVLFVSHNMESINQLCSSGILLENGTIGFVSNDIINVTSRYLEIGRSNSFNVWKNLNFKKQNEYFYPIKMLLSQNGQEIDGELGIVRGVEVDVIIEFEVEELSNEFELSVTLTTNNQILFVTQHTDDIQEKWPKIKVGKNKLKFRLDTSYLNVGEYGLKCSAYIYKKRVLVGDDDDIQPKLTFQVVGALSESPYWQTKRGGFFAPKIAWSND